MIHLLYCRYRMPIEMTAGKVPAKSRVETSTVREANSGSMSFWIT